MLWVQTQLRRGVLNTTLCDKNCQSLSPGTPVSSTNKTDRHNTAEILLKVALNTINPNPCVCTTTTATYILVTLQFIILIGGTVDISTQEVSTNGELKIIHKICGGPWGGECVNRQFMKIILELLGAGILEDFKKSYGHDLLLMTRSFERKKKTFTSSSYELHSIQIPIPYSLIEIVEKKKKRTWNEHFNVRQSFLYSVL
jgi:hypothetical protein